MQSKSMTVFLSCLALDLTYTPASGPKMVKKNNNNSLKKTFIGMFYGISDFVII